MARGRSRGRRGGRGRAGSASGRGGHPGVGRGRGGARGGRARRHGGNVHRKRKSEEESVVEGVEHKIPEGLHIGSDVKPYFLQPVSFAAHHAAQEADKYRYLAAYMALEKNSVEILQGSKVRALAAAWVRHDFELAEEFLSNTDAFTVAEVLKALQLLDSSRQQREEEKKYAKLMLHFAQAGHKGKSRIGRRLVQIKKDIHNLEAKAPPFGSVSGALAIRIKSWTRTIPADQLEYFALHMPTETWQKLADICHLHPKQDFPNLPWFLPYCFDPSTAPDGTLVSRCYGLSKENVNEFVFGVDVPYSHIKKFASHLSDDAKKRIATYTPDLDTVLWNYEDLACEGTDHVITNRLSSGETVSLPYGKLMERLLLFRKLQRDEELKDAQPENSSCESSQPYLQNYLWRVFTSLTSSSRTISIDENSKRPAKFVTQLMPQAERILKSVHVPVEAPVVVIGDASSSMEVAIETATIIGSFLRALTNADLCFFADKFLEPPFIPDTIQGVLDLAMQFKARGCTCHAAGLWPYFDKKKIVKTFIITTDEEENTDYRVGKKNYRFLELFKEYHSKVYPARLVFISFLHHQHAQGQMVEPLRQAGFNVMQFKLDHRRPDLTKLNNLIGQLALESLEFDNQLNELQSELRTGGLRRAFERLSVARSNNAQARA